MTPGSEDMGSQGSLRGHMSQWSPRAHRGRPEVTEVTQGSQKSPRGHRVLSPPGAALLLVEAVLTPGGRGPARALLLSLTMLLQTRGRERTEAEYRAMAANAGFARLFRRRPTGGDYDVMLAQK